MANAFLIRGRYLRGQRQVSKHFIFDYPSLQFIQIINFHRRSFSVYRNHSNLPMFLLGFLIEKPVRYLRRQVQRISLYKPWSNIFRHRQTFSRSSIASCHRISNTQILEATFYNPHFLRSFWLIGVLRLISTLFKLNCLFWQLFFSTMFKYRMKTLIQMLTHFYIWETLNIG